MGICTKTKTNYIQKYYILVYCELQKGIILIMYYVAQNRYFIVLHTGIVWDADSFSFCWCICCHSSDAECVIDSSSQISDVIGSVLSFCCISVQVQLPISPVKIKERSISKWFSPCQKHRWGCDFRHCEISDYIWLCVKRDREIISAGKM